MAALRGSLLPQRVQLRASRVGEVAIHASERKEAARGKAKEVVKRLKEVPRRSFEETLVTSLLTSERTIRWRG